MRFMMLMIPNIPMTTDWMPSAEDVAEMTQHQEPAGADDDGRHNKDKTGAGVGEEFQHRTGAVAAGKRQRPARHGERKRQRGGQQGRGESEHDACRCGFLHRCLAGQPTNVATATAVTKASVRGPKAEAGDGSPPFHAL